MTETIIQQEKIDVLFSQIGKDIKELKQELIRLKEDIEVLSSNTDKRIKIIEIKIESYPELQE